MKEKRTVYNNNEIMTKGKEPEDNGGMMHDQGSTMMERSTGMMGMMQ